MVWPHPRDGILYARSSYYYDYMSIICLFSDILSDFKTFSGHKSRIIAGTFAITLRFLTSRPLSQTGSTLARTNLSPFARCTLGLNRHFY